MFIALSIIQAIKQSINQSINQHLPWNLVLMESFANGILNYTIFFAQTAVQKSKKGVVCNKPKGSCVQKSKR